MRTTLDLPHDLLDQAMRITKAKTKTEAITIALEHIIRKDRVSRLIEFHGNIDLDIDLDSLRGR